MLNFLRDILLLGEDETMKAVVKGTRQHRGTQVNTAVAGACCCCCSTGHEVGEGRGSRRAREGANVVPGGVEVGGAVLD